MTKTTEKGWRGVLVPPPNQLAGIGSALRHAFLIDAGGRSPDAFGDLLPQLDQEEAPPARSERPRPRPRPRSRR